MQIDPGQKLRKAFDEAEKALKASQAVSYALPPRKYRVGEIS